VKKKQWKKKFYWSASSYRLESCVLLVKW
jgi:hypothetical protein